MTHVFATLGPRDPATGLVHAVIDTPRGSRNKYKLDEQLGCLRLSRILPAGCCFPYDFGSIPGTHAEDGDALDVLVLMEEPTFPGCLLTVKLIGVIAARQTEKGRTIRNDRLLACPQTAVNEPAFTHLKQLGTQRLAEMEQFFVTYNTLQGRRFEPIGRHGPREAQRLLDAAVKRRN
jgi:inorganic pyrophosphatase